MLTKIIAFFSLLSLSTNIAVAAESTDVNVQCINQTNPSELVRFLVDRTNHVASFADPEWQPAKKSPHVYQLTCQNNSNGNYECVGSKTTVSPGLVSQNSGQLIFSSSGITYTSSRCEVIGCMTTTFDCFVR